MTLSRAVLLIACGACGVTAALPPASAQPVEGFYVGAGVGLNLLQNGAVTVQAPGGGGKASFGAGYVVSGSLGYGVGNGVRLELEGSWRDNQHDGSGGGHRSQVGVMGNLLYDIDLGLSVTPYLGLGAGWQSVSWSGIGLQAGGTAVSASQTLGGLAYQAIVGLAVPIESVPGLSLTADYRYVGVAGSREFTVGGARARAHGDGDHSVMIGMRYAFTPPENSPVLRPPPSAADAPPDLAAPARTYLVFFDAQRADLTPRGRDVIAEAVRNAARAPYTRIEVAGRSGLAATVAQGAQGLAEQRAQAVAAELRRWGVAESAIDVHAFGASAPPPTGAAGTADGRRVEVVYR